MGGRGAILNRNKKQLSGILYGPNGRTDSSQRQFTVRDALRVGSLSDYSPSRYEGMSEAQAQSVISAEEAIRFFPREHAVVHNAQGAIVAENTGVLNHVPVPTPKTRLNKGHTITHNHPNDSTLSLADVSTIQTHGFEQVRAVGLTSFSSLRNIGKTNSLRTRAKKLRNKYRKAYPELKRQETLIHNAKIDVTLKFKRINQLYVNWFQRNASSFMFQFTYEKE